MEPGRLNGTAPVTAILAALPEEAAEVLGRLEGRTEAPLRPVPQGRARGVGRSVALGRLAGRPVAVLVTGDGAQNARQSVAALLDAIPVSRLLLIGVAGGLTAGLSPGQLIVAGEVVGEGSGSRYRPEPNAAENAAAAIGAERATVVTARRLVLTAAEKRRLWTGRGREATSGVVDLESEAVVEAAEASGIPWLVLRAVSDAADESLPAFLAECSGPDGAIRRSAVLRHALRHPWALPSLLLMRRRIDACGRALADAACELLADETCELAGEKASELLATGSRAGAAGGLTAWKVAG